MLEQVLLEHSVPMEWREVPMLEFHVKRDDLGTVRVAKSLPPPLVDGAARLRLELFGLSSNNITYAAMGEGSVGYWDFFQRNLDGDVRHAGASLALWNLVRLDLPSAQDATDTSRSAARSTFFRTT
jgi:hypothetical protein